MKKIADYVCGNCKRYLFSDIFDDTDNLYSFPLYNNQYYISYLEYLKNKTHSCDDKQRII